MKSGARAPPLRVDTFGKLRELHDGAGLGLPGRRPPGKKAVVRKEVGGERITDLIRNKRKEQLVNQNHTKIPAKLATGKCIESPFS